LPIRRIATEVTIGYVVLSESFRACRKKLIADSRTAMQRACSTEQWSAPLRACLVTTDNDSAGGHNAQLLIDKVKQAPGFTDGHVFQERQIELRQVIRAQDVAADAAEPVDGNP
jgi:hypothetical protein